MNQFIIKKKSHRWLKIIVLRIKEARRIINFGQNRWYKCHVYSYVINTFMKNSNQKKNRRTEILILLRTFTSCSTEWLKSKICITSTIQTHFREKTQKRKTLISSYCLWQEYVKEIFQGAQLVRQTSAHQSLTQQLLRTLRIQND